MKGVQWRICSQIDYSPSINHKVLGCISLNLGRKWMAQRSWVTEESLIKEQFTDVLAKRPDATMDPAATGPVKPGR